MRKKIVMMCMAGVLMLSLCSCGNKSESASTESTAQEETEDTSAAASEEDSTEETKVSEREDYVALEDLEVSDYVTLADYKTMKVRASRKKVTDDLIEEYINANILNSYTVTDRAVADGDLVTIDYEGKKDDVAFEGGTAQGYQLKIGSGTFISGFEDGLIGVTPGETVDLNLTFPENYGNAELAGQEVVFTVTVKNILESSEYADVTPEQLKLVNYDSKEDLWKDAKKDVEEETEVSYQTNVSNAIMEYLVDHSKFISVPQPLVDEEVQNYNEYMEAVCVNFYGCDLETFVTSYYQMTMNEYNAQLSEMAQETVKQYLILEAIARQEGISVTDDAVMEKANEEAADYGYSSGEELLDEVGRTTYRMYMLQDSVMDKLKTIATVETVFEEETEEETESTASAGE